MAAAFAAPLLLLALSLSLSLSTSGDTDRTWRGLISGDPHFTGAQGVRFDFMGERGKSYCLTTDTHLQINGLLNGSLPNRTFVRQLAIFWKNQKKQRQTLHLVARSGKQQERGNGFLQSISLNGKPFAIPKAKGDSVKKDDVTFSFEGTDKDSETKFLDVDHYRVKIGKILDLGLDMLVGHPKEQGPKEAEAHFNLIFDTLVTTKDVHGLLGQTYRKTPEQLKKVKKFLQLVELQRKPVQADVISKDSFLDGRPQDYKTSSLTSVHFRFSKFR